MRDQPYSEALTRHLNRVYAALIAEVERYGGSVSYFAGDSIMCWFGDQDEGRTTKDKATTRISDTSSFVLRPSSAGLHATAYALALQQAMHSFAAIALPNGTTTTPALKVAIALGPARRFAVGDPNVQLFDALAGAPLMHVAAGEHLARPGEVLLDETTAAALDGAIGVSEWRADTEVGERFAVLRELKIENAKLNIGDSIENSS